MKKVLLLLCVAALGVSTSDAQNAKPQVHAKPMKIARAISPNEEVVNTSGNAAKSENVKDVIWGTQIGRTFYDLQSNVASGDRIVRYADGTMAAVWIQSLINDVQPAADRGVGYNYFDGTSWQAPVLANGEFGISSVYAGWPAIYDIGNGSENIISHTNLKRMTRPVKGTGDWSANVVTGAGATGGNWPRVAASGMNVHAVHTNDAVTYNGITGAPLYSRSTDGGVTWDKIEVQLPIDSLTHFVQNVGGDTYAIHARGSNVAIVTGGGSGGSLVLVKSTDNGETWNTTIIHKPATADNFQVNDDGTYGVMTVDGASTVVLDNNGMAHVAVGTLGYQMNTDGFFGDSYYPTTGGEILYWTEGMTEMDTAAAIMDVDGDEILDLPNNSDSIGIYYLGFYSMPQLSVDANNNLFITFSGVKEGTYIGTQLQRDIYVVGGANTGSGIQWGEVTNVSGIAGFEDDAAFVEEIFPSTVRDIPSTGADAGKIHLMFMSDEDPGLHVRAPEGEEDPVSDNSIIYYSFDSQVLLPEVISAKSNKLTSASVELYPNPANDNATLNVTLKNAANVSVVVRNVLGQEVASTTSKFINANVTERISLDVASLTPGVYMYTVQAGDQSVTNKFVKK